MTTDYATGSPRYTFLLTSLSLKGPYGLINIQNVDFVSNNDCRELLLLERAGFNRSGVGRLAYDYRGTKVYVETRYHGHAEPIMTHLEQRGSTKSILNIIQGAG